ncbi:hypothetical protein, partial [Mesorhizobium sp. B2-7-1]|uniref:hypothetical protein n=1 Tax=Mesorhizobium sp. B2-7-1 TaxID=2589909 RepID=UPI001AEE26FD
GTGKPGAKHDRCERHCRKSQSHILSSPRNWTHLVAFASAAEAIPAYHAPMKISDGGEPQFD